MTPGRPFGVYVHIPFCSRRCDYCAFATWTDRHHLHARYAAACRREIARAGTAGELAPATSVFFGGGTPSLVDGGVLMEVLAAIPLSPGAEVTVECNPENVTGALLSAYRAGGVTRLSFGVQSMVPHVLEALGRWHDPDCVRRAVELAGEFGYGGAYSVDLIYGAAGERPSDWLSTLEQVLSLEPRPAHVSAYALTVERGTPLSADPSRHPDDDDQASKYEVADRVLFAAGLDWYEISNWAVPGAECRHNQLYWGGGDYRGVGAAAHSHRALDDGGARRWWNVPAPERYCERVEAGVDPVAGTDTLDPGTRRRELLMLAVRTRDGVPTGALVEDPALTGLVRRRGARQVLTLPGRLLANEVSLRLVDTGAAR